MAVEPPVTLSTIYHANGNTTYWLLWDDRYWRASGFEYGLIKKGATPPELGMYPYEEQEERS